MALSRRTGTRFQASIWPGFVDAMTGLLLVLMFVLTIFMVLQFVLRETITGQENQLSELTAQVAALDAALGIELDENAVLQSRVGEMSDEMAALQLRLSESEATGAQQAALIARLSTQRDELTAALGTAETQITGFEAQVAGLLAEQRDAQDMIAGLQAREADLLTDQEALNLALAQARTEIDEGVEAARLAAARRAALEALVADLETEGAAATEQIAALEAERLTDAAAAEALRARLAEADTELTAMTLALEEQRRAAEDTLTLLAAAEAAKAELDENLAIAMLAGAEAQAVADALGVERDALAAQLAAAADEQGAATTELSAIRDELAAALVARRELEAELGEATVAQDDLAAQLAASIAALVAAQDQTGAVQDETERQAALLAQANASLSEQEALSAESQRQVALLSEQVAALSGELAQLQALLDLANEADVTANVQIESLTEDLNVALARALLAEQRSRALEAAELARLALEAEELQRYRSDFLGLLREVLEDVDGVRIDGDRFVFSSEVLFDQGAAELSAEGQLEIAKVAAILQEVSGDIPDEIDWVIRVDGHTDDVPISGLGEFANNWELSQARALSVVLFMVESLGVPPERLAANGFGQYQPLNPADSDEARAQNRRIELKLTER